MPRMIAPRMYDSDFSNYTVRKVNRTFINNTKSQVRITAIPPVLSQQFSKQLAFTGFRKVLIVNSSYKFSQGEVTERMFRE